MFYVRIRTSRGGVFYFSYYFVSSFAFDLQVDSEFPFQNNEFPLRGTDWTWGDSQRTKTYVEAQTNVSITVTAKVTIPNGIAVESEGLNMTVRSCRAGERSNGQICTDCDPGFFSRSGRYIRLFRHARCFHVFVEVLC